MLNNSTLDTDISHICGHIFGSVIVIWSVYDCHVSDDDQRLSKCGERYDWYDGVCGWFIVLRAK
jgi:hypothetical protein